MCLCLFVFTKQIFSSLLRLHQKVLYVCVTTCLHVHVNLCLCARVHVCACVCVCVHACVCLYLCLHMCVCLCGVGIHMHGCLCSHPCVTCMRACAHVCTFMWMFPCTCLCAGVWVCVYVCVHMCVCVCKSRWRESLQHGWRGPLRGPQWGGLSRSDCKEEEGADRAQGGTSWGERAKGWDGSHHWPCHSGSLRNGNHRFPQGWVLCFPGRFWFPWQDGKSGWQAVWWMSVPLPSKSRTHFSSHLMVVRRLSRGKQNTEKKATGLIPLPNIVREKSKSSGCFLSPTEGMFSNCICHCFYFAALPW